MANEIKTLYSNEEKTDAIFPRTKFNAVSDNNGNTIGNIATLTFIEVSNPSVVVDDFNHPIGTIYQTTDVNFDPAEQWGGTWVLIGDSLPISKHVFGNGIGLGLTDGINFAALAKGSTNTYARHEGFGANVGTNGSYVGPDLSGGVIGVPTKAQLDNGAYPYENTGLVIDAIDCYTWRRTA